METIQATTIREIIETAEARYPGCVIVNNPAPGNAAVRPDGIWTGPGAYYVYTSPAERLHGDPVLCFRLPTA